MNISKVDRKTIEGRITYWLHWNRQLLTALRIAAKRVERNKDLNEKVGDGRVAATSIYEDYTKARYNFRVSLREHDLDFIGRTHLWDNTSKWKDFTVKKIRSFAPSK